MTAPVRTATGRLRWLVLSAVTAFLLSGAGIYAVSAFQRLQESLGALPPVAVAAGNTGLPADSFVLFRNTAVGQGYGMAATVALANPAGPRTIGSAPCDRVYSVGTGLVCLSTNRGLATTFGATLYGANWQQLHSWSLSGIPSRARASRDGTLVATTVFVTGHSYAGTGSSTETVIRSVAGPAKDENLEQFALIVNGGQVTATDRNIWGVTFVPGQPDAFYATAASSGLHWLVRGSISNRTLTAVHDGVECPSISPDGTRIAFKKNTGSGLKPHWKIAILDMATGGETILSEGRSVDDQIEWIDNKSLLYGMSRDGEAGDSDIWRITADAGGQPELYIEHAWSPSVVLR